MRAPVIIFAYNRPEHLKKCIEALASNRLAKETPLYIFSDGPKNENDKEKIESVRSYLGYINNSNMFKSLSIITSKKNKGLSCSVIDGVTKVINKHGVVIVVEDDALASRNFLEYMNKCLDIYQDKQYVGAIGGFTIPINFPRYFKDDVFLLHRGSSYAWATWADRWVKVDWEVSDYKNFRYNYFKRRAFNKYAPDRAKMLDKQMSGVIDSWAIRFSYSMFQNKLMFVMPRLSKIKTIGHDGSGTHSNKSSKYDSVELDNDYKEEQDYSNARFDKNIAKEYGNHFKRRPVNKVKSLLKKIIIPIR